MKKAVKVSTATIKAVTGYASASAKVERAGVKAIDLLRADGVRGKMLWADSKKGGVKEVYDAVTGGIVAALTARDQRILVTPAKGLTDNEKIQKKSIRSKVTGTLGAIRRDLLKREQQGHDGRTASRKRTPKVRIEDNLQDSIKVLQGWEEPKGVDVTALNKLLNSALKLIAKAA